MDPLADKVARRFQAELLTKQWLMGVRRGWLHLLSVKPNGWPAIFKAFDAVRDFVTNLEAQVSYVRRGPYTSVPSMSESGKLQEAIKKLKEAIAEKRSAARHWFDVEEHPELRGGTFTQDQGEHMRKLYEEKFGEMLTTYVPTKIDKAKGKWNKEREAPVTELLDKVLEILRADATRLQEAIKTEEEVIEHGGGEGEAPTKEVFKDPAFKEFAFGRMKVVVTDPKGNGHNIRPYVRLLDIAHQLTSRKGFGDLWYGTLILQSADYRQLEDYERVQYEKAGYKDLTSVAGTFHSGADEVVITAPANDRTIKTICHELGHRYWFKRMSQRGRAKFEEFLSNGVLPVSDYGKSNAVEAFAEAFAWYVTGRDMDRDQIESFKAVLSSTQTEDRSTHPTVIEYAVQTLFKGKSPEVAAKDTAKKLSGSENMFFGPGVSLIDPKKLAEALWGRLVSFTIQGMKKIKPGMEHFALDGTVQHFRQAPRIRTELKNRVTKALGGEPFPNDT